MLEIENINKSYLKQENVLKNISLSFDKGLVCILGQSGSGKTTLLNVLGMLDKAEGSIYVDGLDINKLKDKELDYYRNTYVGFIFQDFNLIEDFTVYENIVLPLKLQGKKIDNELIDNYLKRLGIYELRYRKPNELSGGERQRVAILRAVVKDTKIILADEVTANLDSKTGLEVMNLLKEISKDRLVILVTHNNEYASKYADRIIKIEDGYVNNDLLKHEDNTYKVVKSKLPFLYAFKLGAKSVLKHKFRFILSSIILSLSVALFLSFYKVVTYDIDKTHLSKLDGDIFEIKKVSYLNNGSFITNFIDDYSDIDNVVGIRYDYLDKNQNSDFYKIFKLNTYVNDDFFEGEKDEERSPYYDIRFPIKLVVSDNYDNLIGSRVLSDNEMVITSYIADLFIKYGVYNSNGKLITLKNYNEILNQKFILNGKVLTVKGIIKYDTSKYDSLKQIGNYDSDLYSDFSKDMERFYNNIYVSKNFVKESYIDVVDNTNYTYKLDNNNISLDKYDLSVFYDGVNYKNGKLNDNEIIINLFSVIDSDSFSQEYSDFIDKDPSDDDIKSFIINSIKKYNVSYNIGDNVNIKVYHERNFPDVLHDKIFNQLNLKVAGFTILNNNYVSLNVSNAYKTRLFPISSILVKEDKNSLIKKYPYGSDYIVYSYELSSIVNCYTLINSSKNILIAISSVFLLFSILLSYRFVSLTIKDNKKKIGILRSLGSRNFDILKIFMVETLFLVLFTSLFTFINMNIVFKFLIYQNGDIGIFNIYFYDYLLIILLSSIVYFLSTYLSFLKMLKSKIIELIYR